MHGTLYQLFNVGYIQGIGKHLYKHDTTILLQNFVGVATQDFRRKLIIIFLVLNFAPVTQERSHPLSAN